ncbi:MAG TPA: DUF1329 domain-containing protein [Burkholderiaceae bacterium]
MKSSAPLRTLGIAVALALAGALPVSARLTPAEIERLSKDLTPVGAERAGNADGSIPAWTGGLTKPPAGWMPAKGYTDPFADDKPLFTITAENMARHQDKLSAGTQALLKKYPNFTMPVYPTRRTAAYPARVTTQVSDQAGNVESSGVTVKNAGGSTVPFPIPKTGAQAMLNHNLRYIGGGLDRSYESFAVRSNGEFGKIGFRERRIFDANFDVSTPNLLSRFLAYYTSPAALEGTMYLVVAPVDREQEANQSWIYNAGQRRVRRAPDLAYDAVADGTEGLITIDQYDAFNGALDRFDWKLVGKREMYVAYNGYRIGDKKTPYKDVIQKNTVNAALMRYELHRVWVVEATLKPGSKHMFPRRTFYLDEDSWSVLYEDAYDSRGELWRVGVHGLVQYYDALVPWYRMSVWHDLSNGAYLLGSLDNEQPGIWKFDQKGKVVDFQPDALRRAGIK